MTDYICHANHYIYVPSQLILDFHPSLCDAGLLLVMHALRLRFGWSASYVWYGRGFVFVLELVKVLRIVTFETLREVPCSIA